MEAKLKKRKARSLTVERLEARELLAVDLGNVLFLGDSITHGNSKTDSYRYELWKDLVDAGANFNFVGSQTSFHKNTRTLPSYKGKSFPNVHEGHWGWAAESIINGKTTTAPTAGRLSTWLGGYDPDLALIHLGTNDLKYDTKNNKVDVTVNYIHQIVGLLQADNPNVKIIIAQIIPYLNGQPHSSLFTAADLAAINSRINQMNARLLAEAPTWGTAKSHISVVNQHDDPNSPGKPLPASYFSSDYVHLNGAGADLMATRWYGAMFSQTTTNDAPNITDVRVSSSSWSTSFTRAIDPDKLLGYRIPNGSKQIHTIPWQNVNRIHVTFDEPVVISASSVSLYGQLYRNYSIRSQDVTFDTSNNTATISLAAPILRDRLKLTVFDTVTDLTGNKLDGEWTSQQTSVQSGDGNAGGRFLFKLNVLPGDINKSAYIDSKDLLAVNGSNSSTIGNSKYDFRADIDGNGSVSSTDVGIVTNLQLTGLAAAAIIADKPADDEPSSGLRNIRRCVDCVFSEASKREFSILI